MPLLLTGCLLTPGKFQSTLSINADRTFAFAYKGEVIAVDPSSAMKDMQPSGDKGGKPDPKAAADAEASTDARNRQMAVALAKEAGYKSVAYLGKGKFTVDYAVAGTLSHSFVFPFNSDAEAIIPFVAVEVRKDGTVRAKAPGFAARQDSMNSTLPAGQATSHADGTFTLDTDAEIVSQNNEQGVARTGPRSRIEWRVTPLTKDAPSAVIRVLPRL